jgi:hypothetical protein
MTGVVREPRQKEAEDRENDAEHDHRGDQHGDATNPRQALTVTTVICISSRQFIPAASGSRSPR